MSLCVFMGSRCRFVMILSPKLQVGFKRNTPTMLWYPSQHDHIVVTQANEKGAVVYIWFRFVQGFMITRGLGWISEAPRWEHHGKVCISHSKFFLADLSLLNPNKLMELPLLLSLLLRFRIHRRSCESCSLGFHEIVW